MKEMHLIRDVLDDQLLDRKKRKIGKVDGIVVVLRQGKPPRVAYIETGMSTLVHRIHPRLGRWVERLGKKWGVRQGKPYRIPWSKVKDIGIDTIVDLEAQETPLLDWEKWLNKHFVGRIPWSSN
jgi:sporulation protein YlmC with PRC-barrel domain